MTTVKVLRLDELKGLCHKCHKPINLRDTLIGDCPHCHAVQLSLAANKVLAQYLPAQLKRMQTLIVQDGELIGGE